MAAAGIRRLPSGVCDTGHSLVLWGRVRSPRAGAAVQDRDADVLHLVHWVPDSLPDRASSDGGHGNNLSPHLLRLLPSAGGWGRGVFLQPWLIKVWSLQLTPRSGRWHANGREQVAQSALGETALKQTYVLYDKSYLCSLFPPSFPETYNHPHHLLILACKLTTAYMKLIKNLNTVKVESRHKRDPLQIVLWLFFLSFP